MPELRRLFNKAEFSWHRAMAERGKIHASGNFTKILEMTGEISAAAERIEAALEDLCIMRADYVFDGGRKEVRAPIEDLTNLLLETDFI